MKQSTAWLVSIVASAAIFGGAFALLFSSADSTEMRARSAGGEVLAPDSAPETMSPSSPETPSSPDS